MSGRDIISDPGFVIGRKFRSLAGAFFLLQVATLVSISIFGFTLNLPVFMSRH